jgi:hypothetical protein
MINLFKLISSKYGIVHNINPQGLLYSQAQIRNRFRNGKKIYETIQELENKNIYPFGIEPIKICIIDNKIHSFENRRLYSFLEAGIENISVYYIEPNDNIYNKMNQCIREKEDFYNIVVSSYDCEN